MKMTRSVTLVAFCLLSAALSCSDNGTSPPPDQNQPAPIGSIFTWAGTGHAGFNGDGKDRRSTELYWPQDIAFTPTLGVYISDWNNHRIRRVNADGTVETIIGTPSIGDGPPYPNEGGDVATGWPGTECDLNHPTQTLERKNGMLLIVCWHNHKLREWDPNTGLERVIMGRGPGCTGDGGPASSPSALMSQESKAVEASDGTLYINDQRNQCIRKIDPNGIVTSVVSQACDPNNPTHDPNIFKPGGYTGDGGAPIDAEINQPSGPNPNPPGGGLALDAQERLYIADTNNNCIRRVDFQANVIETVAGTGVAGYSGDGGDPTLATLRTPLGIAFGPDGKLYVADCDNNVVRAVDFDANVITTVAGTGVKGYSGDGGPATQAKLALPYSVSFDAGGDLYICDTYNHCIRRVKMHD
jgi:NHL repeat